MTRPRAATLAAALLAVALAACTGAPATAPATQDASHAAASAGPAASVVPILREELGSTLPGTAPGERLGLWRYVIQPGAQLVPHHHPGWQVARIMAGTLTYNVIEGTAQVVRSDGTEETFTTGQVTELAPGDTVIENPELSHFGANQGSVPVELYTATLLGDGEPPAIPLPSDSPAP